MAEIIESIDAIARRLGRDVLFLELTGEDDVPQTIYADVSAVTDWLDQQCIVWQVCSTFSDEDSWIEGGPGAIFLDVEYIPGSSAVSVLEAYFMDEDGQPAILGYTPNLLQLETAQKYAYRDDPDFEI